MQTSISPMNAVDDFIRSFQWTTVDIFFAITAASIPKSWRGESKTGIPQLNYIANSFNESHSEGPEKTEIESSLNKAGQTELVFHSEGILHEDEKNRQPSVVQLPGFNQTSQPAPHLPKGHPSYVPYPQATSDAQRVVRGPHDPV